METSNPAPDDTAPPVVALSSPFPDPDATPTPAPEPNTDNPNTHIEKLFRRLRAKDYAHEVVQEYFKQYHWKLKVSDEPLEHSPLQMELEESLSPVELAQKLQKVLVMQKAITSWLDYCAKSSKKLFVRRGKPENNEWTRLLSQLSGVRRHKPKALQAHQRWSKDHFETEVKSCFLKKWRKARLPKEKMAAFHDQITRKRFKKLSKEEQRDWRDKAQAEGKAAVKEWNDRLEAPPSTSPLNRQVALDNLATFAGPILSGMSETLGMHVSLFVGGPEPRKQGKITVVSIFKTTYRTHIDCDSCRLPDDLNNLFTITDEGNQSDAQEDREDRQVNKPTKAKYRSHRTKSKQKGTKRARTSRCKPSEPSEMDKSSSESSSTSSGSSSSSSSSGSASSSSTDMDSEEEHHRSNKVLPFSPPKGHYGVTYFNPRHKAAALTRLNLDESTADTPIDDAEISTDHPPVPPAITSTAIVEPPLDNIIARPTFNDNTIDLHLREDSGMAVDQPPAPPAEILGQGLREPVDDHNIDETPSAERDIEGAVDDRDTTTWDKHTVNSNKTANASHDGNISLSLPALPPSPLWFNNPFQQLMNPAPASPRVIQLFEKLVCLEDALGFANEKAALGCEHHPVEVHWWISRGRKGKPTIPDLNAFMLRWWSWWITLQPEWRKCQAPTLTTSAILPHTDDSNWDTLNKPGANGMLSVVATLKWWADGADGKGYEDS
ncbi:uncharacterized protein F5147DRAFT_655152 [Suillus discolor]|uniref:Uncharacterized protein n=1 Tax=Suillus discolor TaxID=1912936 RepID=A0A9P7JRE9_9AGAM|nr:uncharacterized protein F5147DRAFT_655152 [Suillus discolor]KAG2101827.1 hypothetical protein F5147DRAFT_655152 [Suillus discolor]